MANECLKNLPQWVWLVIGIIIFVALFKTFKNKQIMKKVLLTAAAVLSLTFVNAQDLKSKKGKVVYGNFFLKLNNLFAKIRNVFKNIARRQI